MAETNGPVERKVKTGTTAALVSTFILGWLLTAWPEMPDALSGPLAGLVSGAVTAGAAAGTMWLTKHTPRPDLRPSLPTRDGTAIAQAAYAAYGAATGGLNFRDEPMPSWDALPEAQRSAWIAAAGHVRDKLTL